MLEDANKITNLVQYLQDPSHDICHVIVLLCKNRVHLIECARFLEGFIPVHIAIPFAVIIGGSVVEVPLVRKKEFFDIYKNFISLHSK